MSKCVAIIPLANVTRAALVEAGGRSMAQVKAALGCTHIINGWFYNMSTGKAVGNLKINGAVKANAGWSSYGVEVDAGPDIRMGLIPSQAKNYMSGVELLTPYKGPEASLSYNADYGGARGRSAVMLAGDYLVLYCTGDGTRDAKTPEGVRDELVEIGGQYANTSSLRALGLDSGGSSQCDFDGRAITSTRRVAGYLCVWTKQSGKQPPEGDTSMGKYRVTPSIGLNLRSGPGTSYGKVGAYPCGAVVDVLETQDGWGRTDKGWVSMAYLEAVEVAQRTTDTGIAIQVDYIPKGRKNRPGGGNPDSYITIHETGNLAKGADAAAHASWLKSDDAAAKYISYHYTVDDHAIIQHLPDGETAYHAGDGAGGPGNATSIGIEICVNEGGDFERAKTNAAALVRLLMKEHGISLDRVVQHNHWNGKDCPKTIRATAGAWDAFLELCDGRDPGQVTLEANVDILAAAGILDSPDYWKGDLYSTANVHALIGKMADYVKEGK